MRDVRLINAMTLALLTLSVAGCGCVEMPGGDAGTSSDAGMMTDGSSPEFDGGPPPSVSATGCWGQPTVVAAPGEVALAKLSALPSGEALALWVRHDGRSVSASAQRFSTDGGRGQRADLRLGSWAEVDDPLFANNRNGEAIALWRLKPDGGPEELLLASRFALDGGWRPVERLAQGPTGSVRAALTASGEVFVAWVSVATGFTSLVVLHTQGGSWSGPETLSPAGWQVASVALAADDIAVMSWTQWGPPTFEAVATSSLWASSGPRRGRVLRASRPSSSSPELDRLATFEQRAGATLSLSATEFEALRFVDDEWRVGPRLGRTDDAVPAAGVDAEGRLTLWSTTMMRSGVRALVATVETDGGWSEPQVVASQAEPIRFIASATNARGAALLAWPRELSLVVARTEPDGGAIDRLDGLVVIPGATQLAVSPAGVRWMLAQVAEPASRTVLLSCP